MLKYYFLGAHTVISGPGYNYTLTKFGQQVDLPEAQARNHAVHGARLIPDFEWQAIGFTAEELEQNSDLMAHDDTADEQFLIKRKAAFFAADQFRAEALAAAATHQEN